MNPDLGSSTCLKTNKQTNKIMKPDEAQLFFSDMIIFSYELYNYVAARRYWYSAYPEPILVTDGTQFSEEVGKAVLVAWHNHRTTLWTMIKEDYPRYIGTRENLEQYIKIRSKDLMNLCTFENIFKIDDLHFTRELLLVTAFTTEIYFFCYDFGLDYFLPYFVEFWCKLFSELFFERFQSDYNWTMLREECMEVSKIYDLGKVERYLYEKKSILIKGQYFADDEVTAKAIADRHHTKLATKFYHVNEKTKSMAIDKDVELASKFSTLYRICEKIDGAKEEVNEVYTAPKRFVLLRLKSKLDSFLMPEETKPSTTTTKKKKEKMKSKLDSFLMPEETKPSTTTTKKKKRKNEEKETMKEQFNTCLVKA